MQFELETLAPCQKRVSVTIPEERMGAAFKEKLKEINGSVALPGFRKGHAPAQLLERRLGTHLTDEVRDDLLKEVMKQLVEEQKIEPLEAPDIDVAALEIKRDAALKFSFDVIHEPHFEMPEYKGLHVNVPAAQVTDEEIEEQVKNRLSRGAQLEEVEDGTVGEEDVAVLDVEVRDGESVVWEDSGVWYRLGTQIISEWAVTTVEDQLIGKQVGAVATEEVRTPHDDRREELRGKELNLQVTLKSIHRWQVPELDAAWLEANDFDDEAELRDDTRKAIERAKNREREHKAEDLLVDQLLGAVEIELPEPFIDRALADWAKDTRLRLEMRETPKRKSPRRSPPTRTRHGRASRKTCVAASSWTASQRRRPCRPPRRTSWVSPTA